MARKRETCRDCGKHISECGPLSKRGKCVSCGIRNMTQAATQVENRQGPYYAKWREGMVEAGRRVA